jgi:hypothetical protein
MFEFKIKSGLLAAATVGMLVSGLSTGPAAASGIVFTWNPSCIGCTGAPAGTQFTADNFTGSDYSTIDLTGGFINLPESGILDITQFQLGGPAATTPSLNTGYQLYITFTAHATIVPSGPGVFLGSFNDISYKLWEDPTANDLFSNTGTPTATNTAGDIQLAHGSLVSGGQNYADILPSGAGGELPTAGVTASFIQDVPSFFIAPPSFITLNIEASFTNDTGQVTPGCGVTAFTCLISGGSFSADFVGTRVPEPGTLGMVGLGLIMIGVWVRRRQYS